MSQSSSTLAPIQFVQQVLASRPTIAVFDCDGTLWAGDSGMDFFYWELEHGFVPQERIAPIKERYAGYLAGTVSELAICGEMIQINEGVDESYLRQGARNFFNEVVARRIFPEMQHLTKQLAAQGCELWAVSSTNNWVVEAGMEHFGIPAERVLAATLEVKNGKIGEKLLKVPTDELKQTAIEESIGRTVDAVFGNSMHDFAMLEKAKTPYAINPNNDLATEAARRGWTIYQPEVKL